MDWGFSNSENQMQNRLWDYLNPETISFPEDKILFTSQSNNQIKVCHYWKKRAVARQSQFRPRLRYTALKNSEWFLKE
jgi:hypothetical protein